MTILIAGIILFFSVHAIPLSNGVRNSLVSKVGPRVYKITFSLIALAGFTTIIFGMKGAPFEPLWAPPPWSAMVAGLLMPVAFCLLVAAHLPNNFTAVVRHPMLAATLIWSLVHLLSNGDVASALLFGSFGLFATVDIVSLNFRGEKKKHSRKPFFADVLVIAIGLTLFWLVRYFHGALFGMPIAY